MYSINEKTINIDDMNTKTLNCEVSTYWKQVKSANQQIKLVLISMFSASLVTPQDEVQATDSSEKLYITREGSFRLTLDQGIKPLSEYFDYDKAKLG